MFKFLLIIWLITAILNTLIFVISAYYYDKKEFVWLPARKIQKSVYGTFFEYRVGPVDWGFAFVFIGFISVFWPIIVPIMIIIAVIKEIIRAIYSKYRENIDNLILKIFNSR